MRPHAVVDASVAVKWFVPEARSDEADALAGSRVRLIAPSLIKVEVASAFAKKARAGLVAIEDATEYLSILPHYFVELVDPDAVLPSAMALAKELDHAIYDCIYIEIARRRSSVMVTDDARLVTKLGRHEAAAFVVALSDWSVDA